MDVVGKNICLELENIMDTTLKDCFLELCRYTLARKAYYINEWQQAMVTEKRSGVGERKDVEDHTMEEALKHFIFYYIYSNLGIHFFFFLIIIHFLIIFI